ncbi:uridine kinase [bacterium]|nr:uridine kinase [bacterium]
MEMKPYFVGIAGGSASGKSRFLRQLATLLQHDISVVSLDDFYKPLAEQCTDANGHVNFDLPESIDQKTLFNCVLQLKQGLDVSIKEYHFNNPQVSGETFKVVKARPVILLEGLFIFHFQEIFDLLDLKVFIQADDSIRFARRIARDTRERGISPEMVSYQWHHHVQPAYQQYLSPFTNKVDLIVNNNQSFDKALRILHQHLQSEINGQ